MPSVGVVLGAGGLVGLGYHVHVLTDLQHQGILDIRDAEVVVGTSAGSLVAGLLTSGIELSDLRDALNPLADTQLSTALARLLALRTNSMASLKRPERPQRHLGERRQRVALWSASLFGEGEIDATEIARGFDQLLPDAWPSQLQVCSLERHTAERAVWHQHHTAPLPVAVAASCAVPGIFRPVTIDDHEYVDGGFWSPTNADVLLGRQLDQIGRAHV